MGPLKANVRSLVAGDGGPSFKQVTTVHKQNTNLINSVFTALRAGPGQVINIKDLPGERRERESGRHVRQMEALIDERA